MIERLDHHLLDQLRVTYHEDGSGRGIGVSPVELLSLELLVLLIEQCALGRKIKTVLLECLAQELEMLLHRTWFTLERMTL